MICGPIGHGNINEIKRMHNLLEGHGFEILNQFEKGQMNYSHVQDFRKKNALSKRIIKHDLLTMKKADVLIILQSPSFGAAIEMYVGKTLGKKIIFFSKEFIPSPWPIEFSDHVITSEKSLVRTLQKLAKNK